MKPWQLNKRVNSLSENLADQPETQTRIDINLEKALFQNAADESHVKVAQNLDEACKLLEVGFEYVTEIDGAQIFRKRK